MKPTELKIKISEFAIRLPEINKRFAQAYYDRNRFVKLFPLSVIKELDRDEYVLGKHDEGIESFCYFLETKLYDLGRIGGSNALQYGVYFGNSKKDPDGGKKYRHSKKYGETFDESFNSIKGEIYDLLIAGRNNDYEAIAKNAISAKFKGKILSTYFPDKYLPIFSDDYLYDIIIYFNLDGEGITKQDPIYKQLHLIKFKNSHLLMKSWNLDEFAMFINNELYLYYYKSKNKQQASTQDLVPEFEDIDLVDPEYVEHELIDPELEQPKRKGRSGKGDYEGKSRRDKAIGDRGEMIVEKAEKDRLGKKFNRPDLADKVDWVSKVDDSVGYDILSFDVKGDGSYVKKYIEVKSSMNFSKKGSFFLSENELSNAKSLPNYHIYYVYNLSTQKPKIWDLGNPFCPINQRIKIRPVIYKVFIAK